MRTIHGAGTGNAGDVQPHTERAPTDVGAADGLGARAPGTQTRRSTRRAGHRHGPRRLRSRRRARRRLRRHRRRPGHRVDGTATGGATQDGPDAHPHPAPTRRGHRATTHAQQVTGARAPDHGRRRPRGRSASPHTEGDRGTRSATETPHHRHRDDQPARLERRHRPHRVGFRPAETTGACRDRGAG